MSVTDGDSRKDFVLSAIANYFGTPHKDPAIESLRNNDRLIAFLDDANANVLSASVEKMAEGSVKIHIDNATNVGKANDKVLVLFKARPEIITPDNLHTIVLVNSMLNSPISSLFHALQKIYSPLLLKDAKWSQDFDPKLQSLITELEKGLGVMMRRQGDGSSSGEDHGLTSILTPNDEAQYWADEVNQSKRRDSRERASAFFGALEPMAGEFAKIDTLQLSDGEELLENVQNTLDDLWKIDEWEYPQSRMVHLMDVIAHAITRFIQIKCGSIDLWKAPYAQVEEALQMGIGLCEKLISTCEQLTTLYWPNYGPHRWEGGPYKPEHAINVHNRLNEVLGLRTLHRQLSQLLSLTEQTEMRMNKSFDPFDKLIPVQYSPYTEPLWRAAVTQFENSLVPAERRIAGKLRSQLRNMDGNTMQLLQEFKRYKETIVRPSIQRDLVAERESLLGKLSEYIDRERKTFANLGPNREVSGVPKSLTKLYHVPSFEARLKDTMTTGEQLLSDLGSWPALKKEMQEFHDEIKQFQKEDFERWCTNNLEEINSNELTLQTNSQVVYFEAGKDMKVSYNRRLVGLHNEVRVLACQGYNIPQKIMATSEQARKFAKLARDLERIASFHNTIGDRMITSQRPLMLDAAVSLAQLVKEQTDMTWNSPDKVQRYIGRLQQHVEQLARQNNKLAAYHKTIAEKVVELMDVDLLKQQNKWKDGLKEIRQIMNQVEQQGFSNLKSWRNHWDHQLYKALEHQYQLGLEALNDYLPEIEVFITYRQQSLQFQPPIEEIRMKYYSQLKRFLAIPNNFRGASESSENLIFPIIIERNAHRFSHLFKKAEELFVQLEKRRDSFLDWVALGSIDVEDFISEHFQSPEDWDQNFSASKARGQDIGRLPSGKEKLQCISINFAPLRSEIELLNRKYWDVLAITLQRSIVRDIETIEKFTTEATENLRRQPQTVEEIGEANQLHKAYQDKTPDMLTIFENADKKNKILAKWTKEQVEHVHRIGDVWDNFVSLMDNHEDLISRQVEAIKGTLNTDVSNLNTEIDKFKLRWDAMKPKEDNFDSGSANVEANIRFIKEKRKEWAELIERRDKIQNDHSHFGLDGPEFPQFDLVEEDLAKIENTWSLFDEFHSTMKEMANEEWIIFRSKSYKFEEFLGHWYDKITNAPNKSTISVRLLQEIEQYKNMLPVLKYVRGEIFSDHHWNEMYGILNMPRKGISELKFEDFLNVKQSLADHAQDLQELNNRAAGEVVIRQALSELDVWEIDAKFTFTEHQASSGELVPLIKDWKDVLNKVGDNQVLLQSIKGSPYYTSFGDRATAWESKLSDLDEILNNLNAAQRKWVYLEPYQEQMKMKSPAQTGGFDYKEVFRKIDDDFRMIMRDCQKDTRVVAILKIGSVKSILHAMLERLERCQKSLNEFLEEKRSSFPRFYFIGDDDLLQILGQASKPAVIQTHMKKLFAGIYNVNFDEDSKHIITMNSIEGEIVPLKNKVRISSEVEKWLNELSNGMKETLQKLLVECLADINANKNELDPLKYPSQILCLAEAIEFTKNCEKAIKTNGLQPYLAELKDQLESYTSVDLDDDGESSQVLELKLKALILDTIHYIQVVEQLIEDKVRLVDDWLWRKQLRFYMGDNNIAKIAMVDAEFEYTYEYQGNAPKLVHTPLTDKCYLTLTQGMRVGLGGNPYGPAGTGKTESVKALGGLFGRQVLVFNCDEGIDVKSMGRIFTGLIKCGAWGCFDEFNRLEEQTLSAVSMQIQPIQTALRKKKTTVSLLGKEIPLDANSGIFVTMNPAGKGYGGRQKLPDNLKQLFRPVAMTVPDNDIIAEVSLYSEGFKEAKNIGQKLVNIFTLSSKLLTSQQHYDWGLRALKTVLKGCGNMLKMTKKSNPGGAINEPDIVVQALRLNTLSKLTYGDSIRFDTLVKDVFPNVAFNTGGHNELKEALNQSFDSLGYIPNENQVKKAIELYEQLQQRMGVVIVGPSGSGKTTLFTILKHAIGIMGKTVKQHTMNPKAIPRTQLLGNIDLDTREWTNGVLTVAALEAVDEPVDVNTWIVCDGDIDPEWVESLNSVLDDNRLLTLPSGWRIQFGPNVNFIFETHDLSFASPATISRMGMIFLSDEDTDIRNVVYSWVSQQKQDHLKEFVDEIFFKAVDWCIKANDFVVDTSLVGCVLNGLSLMNDVSSRLEFAVNLYKGLAGNINESSRDGLAKEIFSAVGESAPGRRASSIYFNKNRDRIDSYDSDVNVQLTLNDFNTDSYPVVQTSDVKGILSTLMTWLDPNFNQPFLLVGPEGSGKSLMLKYCFKQLRNTNVAIVHCSAHITPQHVIQKLAQMCLVVSSSNGRIFRPKECDRLVLYLKDLNLAKPDKYGTCMLIAFLQQILTYGGFYDNLEWVGLEAVTIVGSMTAGTGLGRHALSPRFTSVIRLVSVSEPDKEYLDAMCSSYLGAVFTQIAPTHPVWSSRSKLSQLASSMVSIYGSMKKAFSVDDKSHYTFTPKHLTEWCLGLVRYLVNDEDKSASSILEAWTYEACRLFRDKLANEEDEQKFDSLLKGVLQSDWNSSASGTMLNSFYVTHGDSNFSAMSPLPLFGRKLGLLSPADWEAMVEKGMTVFAREHRVLDAVIIKELLALVASCDRVLSKPGGSLLMCGRSGVGRRTAVSIVSALHQAKLVSLKMSKNYGVKQFKSELKAAMQMAGVDNDQVFFLLEDHNLITPQFLDMINSLLSSGEVPGLYSPEELEPLLTSLRVNAQNEGFSGNLFAYFAQAVKKNLHVILIADVTHPDFVKNCESNPALYKECQAYWMETWSERTMIKLPELILTREDRVEGEDIGNKSDKKKRHVSGGEDLINSFYRIESSLPPERTNVKKYVTFIKTYQEVYKREKTKITSRQDKLSKGVSKLMDAKNVVTKLKGEAAVQEKELAEKQKEANDALIMIKETMQNASHQKIHMEDLRGQTLQEERDINVRKKDIDIEMAEIEPLVIEAKKAVGNIKNSTLSEVRALRAPPEVIRDILEGVLCLMGVQDTSWNSMKTFLAKRGVKEEILAFDARRVNPANRQKVEQLLEERSSSFDPAVAKKASAVAAPLASWVLANVKFSYVLDKIKPLEQEQARLQRSLKMAEDQIGQLSTGLSEVDAQVKVLQERLNKFTKEAAITEIQLTKTKETIEAADGLVAGLESEFHRWNQEVENMEEDLQKIPYFCLLGAAFISYLSNAPEDVRKKSLDRWQSMFSIKKFDLKYYLSSEREMLQWRSEGLPSDELSIENAICVLQSQQSPYIIDPSARASQWLKKHLEQNDVPFEVTTQEDDRFLLTLELAIRFGKTLVIEQVNTISPLLYPILRKDLMGQGVYKVVQVGEKQVDFNPKFKLFLATRNDRPDIPPDASSILGIINFTTTKAGLTGQLLATILHHEKPELEQRKSELLKVEEDHKIQISKLEDFLLEQLATSQGNILENKELLSSLNDTKEKSANIAASLKESTVLQESLEAEGNVYLPVAKFASTMFFTLTDLTKLNNMYRISLGAFTRLFERTLVKAPYKGDENADKRNKALRHTLQDFAYQYVSRSLFKADRLSFAMHLVHGMYPDLFGDNEWEAFIGLLVGDSDNANGGGLSLPNWIAEDRIPLLARLRANFPTLYETLQLEDNSVWSAFSRSKMSEEEDVPIQLAKRISNFQKVLVIQALRPESLVSAMENFVQKSLGLKELSPPALSLKSVYLETANSFPVLIIISSGSDPSEELRELSQKTGKEMHEVAMGQGQADFAVEKIREAAKNGSWVFLKNLHLMTFWVPVLEKELQSLELHEDFRLWLTAESHLKFPATLLETCLKVTYESPPGIKRNLQRTLQSWSPNVIEGSSDNVLRAQAVFTLAWFHAIVQERRIFIPQGWCKFYEFSDGDLKAGLEVLDQLSKNKPELDWKTVHGLYSNAIYGGRVDDSHDIRILVSYLEKFFNGDVIAGTARARVPLGPIELPVTSQYTNYADIVNKLPEDDSPSVFGLPDNIMQSYQRTCSTLTVNQLRTLMRSVQGAAKFEKDKWHNELNPILNLWKKLNQGSTLLQLKLNAPSEESANDPIKAFVQLEFYNAVRLIQAVHKSMASLVKVIRGTQLLDEKVALLADNLMRQETPAHWQKMWDGPEDPMVYVKAIVDKASAVQRWNASVERGKLLGSDINLAELFNPATFLGALRQVTARDYNISMDELKFANSWTRGGISSAKMPIKVLGIKIEGALFDGVKLSDSQWDSPTFSSAPACTFAWVPKTSADHYRQNEAIKLPLYNTNLRDKILTYVQVPSGGDENKWLRAGTILFLDDQL